MAIWYDGQVDENEDVLSQRWKESVVYEGGGVEGELPYYLFEFCMDAVDVLKRHMNPDELICVHCDVDMDGVSAGKIVREFIKGAYGINVSMVINSDKSHGIKDEHIQFFNSHNFKLVIIVDSSSTSIDVLEKANFDVIVLDHHEISMHTLRGSTEDGHEYVIINNMKDNENLMKDLGTLESLSGSTGLDVEGDIATPDMSGAVVAYEFLRVYGKCYGNESVLANKQLYQWAGLTLYTDSINTLNERCQWYLERTVHNMGVEPSLHVMIKELNKYKNSLDKSFINYSLASTINPTIRAGKSSLALNVIINHPDKIGSLMEYKTLQQSIVERATSIANIYGSNYVVKDVTSHDINDNYCGVIASRMLGEFGKNSVCYTVINGVVHGHFRGVGREVDYRKGFLDIGAYAEGHRAAFGFKCLYDDMIRVLSRYPDEFENKPMFSLGSVPNEHRGKYHIVSAEQFKKSGMLWRIALGNSNVCSQDEIYIRASIKDTEFVKSIGKLYVYSVMGIECKAFAPLESLVFDVYAEYSDTVNCYIREITKR